MALVLTRCSSSAFAPIVTARVTRFLSGEVVLVFRRILSPEHSAWWAFFVVVSSSKCPKIKRSITDVRVGSVNAKLIKVLRLTRVVNDQF